MDAHDSISCCERTGNSWLGEPLLDASTHDSIRLLQSVLLKKAREATSRLCESDLK